MEFLGERLRKEGMLRTNEGGPGETTPFLDLPSTARDSHTSHTTKLLSQFFGILVAVSVGVYAGICCRSAEESWMYSTLFCVEGLATSCFALILKTHAHRKTVVAFATYFVISAILTPCAYLLGFHLE
jgi:hypothetical protein